MTSASALPVTTARAALAFALLIGVAGDALLRAGPVGAAFPLWIALLAAGAVALCHRADRPLSREATGWLVVAVLFAAGLAWRESDLLDFVDLLAAFGALAMAAIALSERRAGLFAARLRDTIWAMANIVRSTALGVVPLALQASDGATSREPRGTRVLPALRTALIVVVLLLVFGSLLRGADPIFASLVKLPDVDLGEIASHLVVIGFFTWLVGGWARGALRTGEGRFRAPDRLPLEIGLVDVTAALGTLNALFALFVLIQLGWFFGGEQFLRAQTGLTVAEYARRGFFQMVWVVVLVVPLLLATRAALRPGGAVARRHTMLSLPLIVLLCVMILSAVARMRLYVSYYGLTTERFYPLVLMGWLALVLVWFALTVLRDRGRPFAGGALVSGLVALALLNLVAPDAIVARANVARASQASTARSGLDFMHLASLSGEAAPIAVAAILLPPAAVDVDSTSRAHAHDDRCRAARRLLRRWGDGSRAADRSRRDGAWRSWNAGERSALTVVGGHAAELRQVARTCAASPPTPQPR
jgi:hypothetical protein